MTNALLAIIAGLLVVDLFVRHVVNDDGSVAKDSIYVLYGAAFLAAAVCYGIAYLFSTVN